MQNAADLYEDALNRMNASVNYYNPNGSENHYRYGRGATNGIYDYSSRRVGDLRQIGYAYSAGGKVTHTGHYASFDTGGYTGEWGSTDGRLAILHKKELVLDEEDTKNILNSVSILRSVIKNAGTSFLNKISGLSADRFSAGLISNSNEAIDQNVHISATFPNVNSKK